MRTILAGLVLCVGCGGGGPETSAIVTGDGAPPFVGYHCEVVDSGDDGACLASFLAGDPSPCVYTRRGSSIDVVRPGTAGYELVATCSP